MSEGDRDDSETERGERHLANNRLAFYLANVAFYINVIGCSYKPQQISSLRNEKKSKRKERKRGRMNSTTKKKGKKVGGEDKEDVEEEEDVEDEEAEEPEGIISQCWARED